MVTRKIVKNLVSTKFDFLSIMPKTVFYNLRNPFSTVFSLKIFEPFIAPRSLTEGAGDQKISKFV